MHYERYLSCCLYAGTLFCSAAMFIGLAAGFCPPAAAAPERGAGRPLQGYVIVVDPGHGGDDPGTVGCRGTLEKDIDLAVGKRLAALLQQAGAKVILTREQDKNLADGDIYDSRRLKVQDLSRRVALANDNKAHVLISVHMNHFSDPAEYGAQAFYQSGSEESKKLAALIQIEMNRRLIDSGRQAMAGDFYVCRHARMPAVIVEAGFLSHPGEESKLRDPAYQEKAAQAVLTGLQNYFGAKANNRGRRAG
ncbi:N-acetylmuramoyl-L-alanine amidase [Desulfotomaculum copahuensis]|uniref:MurNAc-LAA domain-containing protein n=1 Tax=Desulfotomaculum copahuensis TaxID=1838280 RepID=A0A1B7LIT2_9FIRM|nr:N-acetylmuramoyl-L-alanine amidase [Desulfotomaculum copahuensis]OAT86463.1 hypothetical protein A6M21_03320 [Desulfotomaculum copahuensis]